MLYLYCYVKLKYNLSIILAALFFSCEDHEVEGQAKVQGSLLSLPLHAGSDRQGEGRQTEAVLTTRCGHGTTHTHTP